MEKNLLYYGDNLDVLKRHIRDESVDLVYLDPPFNSNATYNVLFAEQNGTRAAAQIKAFEDTWRWDQEAAREYEETVETGGEVSKALMAFRTLLGESNMMAYLAMMAPRLMQLRRVLKPTGSIYLHCDPTASHYLKMLMDSVFGAQSFRNEIIWKRTGSHGSAKRWGDVHDTILFYSKTNQYKWNRVYQSYDPEYVSGKYVNEDQRGRYQTVSLTAAGTRKGESGQPWRLYDPTKLGRHWAVPGGLVEAIVDEGQANGLTVQEKLDLLDEHGLIYWSNRASDKGGGFPRFRQYLGQGVPVQTVVTDIPPINSQARERLGFPTQKPVPLLERIIEASSDPGDTVLDPFCGCGTTIIASEKLKRNWIGIDITHLAITLIKNRIHDSFGEEAMPRVIGEPVTVPDAEDLAASDPYQFQWWALGLVGARPIEQKKGADKGIDGRLYFHDEAKGKTKQVILSVKAGSTGAAHLRDLRGVLDREQAEIGVLISMEEPTGPMRKEAAAAGFYHSPGWGTSHPRLQILTVAELLGGKSVDYPSRFANVTFRRAPRAEGPQAPQLSFTDDAPEDQED